MRTFIILLFLYGITGCENNKSNTTQTATTDTSYIAKDGQDKNEPVTPPVNTPPSIPPGNSECYMHTSGRDTVVLQLDQSGNTISGKMKFDNYQIDGSSGPVKGTVNGDIIELWYDSAPEGIPSVRQLFFKRADDRLLWGKGVQVVRNDSTLFKDAKDVTYSEILFMRRMDCEIVKAVLQ